MKVKCPTCNVKMKPYQREEIFPDGDTMINLKCPECGMKASLSYFRSEVEEYFESQEIIDKYNEGRLDDGYLLKNFLSSNPFLPAYNIANYVITELAIKPDLTFIDEDTIKLVYPTTLASFKVCINLDENSVIYTFVDSTGSTLNNPLPSRNSGLAYCDFGSVSGLNDLCRALDEVATEFIVQEMRCLK